MGAKFQRQPSRAEILEPQRVERTGEGKTSSVSTRHERKKTARLPCLRGSSATLRSPMNEPTAIAKELLYRENWPAGPGDGPTCNQPLGNDILGSGWPRLSASADGARTRPAVGGVSSASSVIGGYGERVDGAVWPITHCALARVRENSSLPVAQSRTRRLSRAHMNSMLSRNTRKKPTMVDLDYPMRLSDRACGTPAGTRNRRRGRRGEAMKQAGLADKLYQVALARDRNSDTESRAALLPYA